MSNTRVNIGFIAACYCEFEAKYETEYDALIDSHTQPPIDSASTIDTHPRESIESSHANETFALPVHCYPSFAIKTQPQTSIGYHYGDTISRQGDYSIGSWADDSRHESFVVNTELPEMRSDEDPEGQALAMDGGILNISKEDIAEIIAMNESINFLDTQNRVEDPPSIDKADVPSINGQFEFRLRALHQNMKRKPHLEMRNEYREISTVPEQDTYSKSEVDELVKHNYRAMKTTDDYHSTRLNDIYYPFDNSINWLTTHTDEMKQNIAMIQEQHAVGA
ncbi:hypothetical protein DY000_02031423 [Brassica cretica]|uniref:Uncharacterized protein n=1 Tax=Brassica cretica TaxID=69181 RepID=A0ABQ7DI25_BRACR|nr:hypothetical protein DY000_02031423 [Brassica cretica]